MKNDKYYAYTKVNNVANHIDSIQSASHYFNKGYIRHYLQNEKNAPEIDGISNKCLKISSKNVITLLTNIINSCRTLGVWVSVTKYYVEKSFYSGGYFFALFTIKFNCNIFFHIESNILMKLIQALIAICIFPGNDMFLCILLWGCDVQNCSLYKYNTYNFFIFFAYISKFFFEKVCERLYCIACIDIKCNLQTKCCCFLNLKNVHSVVKKLTSPLGLWNFIHLANFTILPTSVLCYRFTRSVFTGMVLLDIKTA